MTSTTLAESDRRLVRAMELGQEGRVRDAQEELEAILAEQPDHVLANHALDE